MPINNQYKASMGISRSNSSMNEHSPSPAFTVTGSVLGPLLFIVFVKLARKMKVQH